jgi:hypothetical protein
MAQSVLDKVADSHPSYEYGRDFVNLGYIPGQAAAARLLYQSLGTALPSDFAGTSVDDLELMSQVTTIEEVELLIELASTQDTLRWWIEQASTLDKTPDVGAAVSASVEALVRPYHETEPRQLVGLVGGVPGAATYETLSSGQDSPSDNLATRLDSQLAGHVILVLVILIGNGIYLVQRGARKER